MRKFYFLVLGLLFGFVMNAQIIDIPDAIFKEKLLDGWSTKNQDGEALNIDVNSDGEISQDEALAVYKLEIPAYGSYTISNLTGINFFLNLTSLNCDDNSLSSLNLSTLINLTEVSAVDNSIFNINLSGLTQLSKLNINDNYVHNIDLSTLVSLKEFHCNDNSITTLNLSSISNLEVLNCRKNNIVTLNVSGQANLKLLDCYDNTITNLDVSGLIHLEELYCSKNNLEVLNVSTLTSLINLACDNNSLTALNTSMLLNLNYLSCRSNQMTSLMLSPNITTLDCSMNLLTVLDVVPLVNLTGLQCSSNSISVLDVAGLTNLTSFQCQKNQLTNINVNTLVNLQYFSFGNINLEPVNINTLLELTHLQYYGGLQTEIILNHSMLQHFTCIESSFTQLDFSLCHNIQSIYIYKNPQLESINTKNGGNVGINYFYLNPQMKYFCTNESDIVGIQNSLAYWSAGNNIQVNSYCSFNPGGLYNTISGIANFDFNSDGCQNTDMTCNFLKININDGITTGAAYTNQSGNYSFSTQNPNLIILPSLENPYFNISPTSATFNFGTINGQTEQQNFCITANGTHPDLEITVLPIDNARPGFDSHYIIIYKNKGNQTLSGAINFQFEDGILDLVSSSPLPENQSESNLSWTYSDLHPFQSEEIALTFNINSPLETPPVNGNDILQYTASIVSSQTDETPLDNIFMLNQTVVNSFDPNDKTCLEGTTITPEMVGKYVHYIIRFENTGTADAKNIVVKDMIDITKFDVSSLIPLDGSHPFTTRISSNNKVEFIFENIQLPFDDNNNDGFVAFKIKTLPTLAAGDSFSNTASIYFDYNFPIVTDPAITTIQVLGREDFKFENYFTLYPNPASNILNIKSIQSIEISWISIYNTLGQLVLVVPNATDTIDVSALTTGNYFMKVISDKGSSSARFVKE